MAHIPHVGPYQPASFRILFQHADQYSAEARLAAVAFRAIGVPAGNLMNYTLIAADIEDIDGVVVYAIVDETLKQFLYGRASADGAAVAR